jgi:outer membrane protein assembly factor BamB
LNASTGAQLWNQTSATSFTTPVVQDGTVYVCALGYTLSTDVNRGSVYAFNASTGEKLWEFLGPEGSRFDFEPLILQHGSMYVLSSSYSSRDASWRSGVYAFNAQTGEKLWNTITAGRFGSLVANSQAVFVSSNYVDTRQFIDADRSGGYIYSGGVLAINSSSGTKIWSFPVNSSVKDLFIEDGTVYATSSEGILYSFSGSDGKVIWSYTAGTGLGSILSVNGYLYVSSSSGVYCFSARDGTVVWNFAAVDLGGSSPTLPTYANGIIYLGWNGPMFFSRLTQHNFYALSASNGEKLWNYTIPYTVTSSPTVENGTVYIGGTFVSSRSPDHENSGSVVALKSSIESLPSSSPLPASSPSVPEFPQLAILPIFAVAALATGFLKKWRRK